MKNDLGNLIRYHRKRLGMTQAELAQKLGVKKQTVTRYENGMIENLKRSTIQQLAEIFDISPTVLLGMEDDVFSFGLTPLPQTYQVPVVGEIACGTPITAEQNIMGYAAVDFRTKVDFALICKGDSMINARIYDGDLVYIREQPDVENGEIAAVLIDGEATLKRVYKYPNRIELRPENPMFPVLNYEEEQLNDIRILGKAIAFLGAIR